MPGIVGIIGVIPPERAERELRQMIDAQLHENFYLAGTCAVESLGVYVGWVARKGSFSERMPLRNERGDTTLLFSGEEFPESGTAQRLRERGHELAPVDCGYLVHLYEDDPSFPSGLNGRFHGLLVDQNLGTAMLFNDRYGMHRLYYRESNDAFYFAAEAKAILAVCPECRRLNPQGMGEFVACGAVLENRTLFEGIQILPPASKWTFRNCSIEHKDSYFLPRQWEDQEKLKPEAYYQELRQVFSRNLPRYFNGNERIGMSLTGGLDTRMILASKNFEAGSLPCYTFGSMFHENRDVRISRYVAKACDQPHRVLTVGEEFLSQFPHYAERAVYLTDGCVDVERAPDLYLNEKARKIAPVRMTGNYGGEILRGVRAFKPEKPSHGLFHPDLLRSIHLAGETYAGITAGQPVSFAAFKQAPWHHYGILALEQTQLSMRSPYLDNDFVRTVFRSPESALRNNEVCLRLIADGNKALLRIPTDRGLAGHRGSVLRAASRTLLELQFKAEYAYDMGMPQWLCSIDHVLAGFHLENLFLGRHKVFHFRVWYRDVLAGYLQDMLLDSRSLSRPYLERKGLEMIVRDHVNGRRNHTTELHKVLGLELLHRIFLDSNGARTDTKAAANAIGAKSTCV